MFRLVSGLRGDLDDLLGEGQVGVEPVEVAADVVPGLAGGGLDDADEQQREPAQHDMGADAFFGDRPGAYGLVSTGRLNGRSFGFQLLNLFGLLANGVWHGAWPSAALNGIWLVKPTGCDPANNPAISPGRSRPPPPHSDLTNETP